MEKARHGPPAPIVAAEKLWAPLAVALDAGRGRVAAADYQGWGRRGVRFMPSRPTVHVYDRQGKLIRRIGPEGFAEPFWCELAFSSDGASVLAWPHNWASRGLAGQAVLPADGDIRKLYVLDIATGKARAIGLPAAISSVAHSAGGTTAVACWNGRVYLLDSSLKLAPAWAKGLRVGAACLVRISRDGRRILAAGTDGVVRMLDGAGRELWQTDLSRTARRGPKPWTKDQKAERIAAGIWRTNGGLAHSDMGSQYLVEAPGGLILIEANSGHSFEQNWARIRGAGLDPMKVRYVLLTHEHGDHAPGAYLWRVVTGARVVASRETAYVLQHCLPGHTGYAFHPPNKVDIVLTKDRELALAGLPVRAVRVPSHTWGSTAWVFRKEGKAYAATGDLIMPGGVLGYDGSVDFSGKAVLASLRKLARMDLDVVLGGHGGGSAGEFLGKGIGVGEATGWGRTKAEKPDPLHGFASKDCLVAAWLEKIYSAAFGDVNGDGRPDVAVLVGAAAGGEGLTVKVYLNKGGSFRAADVVLDLPDWLRAGEGRLLMGRVNKDRIADLFVHGQSRGGGRAVLLVSRAGKLEYEPVEIRGPVRTSRILPADLNGDGLTDLALLNRFAADQIAYQSQAGTFRSVRAEWRNGMDLRLVDVNGDGRGDLVTSGGDVLLRRPNGSLTPPLQLEVPKEWTWVAAGDFDKDGRTELALLTQAKSQDGGVEAWVFENTGNAERPFAPQPTRRFGIPGAAVLRCGPTVADWNGDGVADVILAASGREGAMVLPGRAGRGLDPKQAVRIRFDYQVHHDTPMGVADFNGDGKADLAAFAHSHRTVPGVFIRLQKPG
jgi:metallo-beta-lactamase class B